MIYGNTQELIELLKKNGVWAKKDLGQNFLVNPEILEKIIGAADLKKSDSVVEIGPGPGILTIELAKRAATVRTIELDAAIIPLLQENIRPYTNVELETGNALRAKLPEQPYKLVANIPYYITSPLISHFLNVQKNDGMRPSIIVLLVQKEVAEKICAKDGEHTVLSLQVQVFGKPSIVSAVGKSSFYPQPKVDSAILKIEVYPVPLIADIPLFLSLIKKLFAQRRKTLLNTLQNQMKFTRAAAEELLKTCAIEPNRRPQSLTMNEWEKMVQEIEKTATS
ncbi:MAG TPA: 16S rRNA (adenine(1518)-N(6)/adenine(1519)-N(6))-dimethyltransferase RsmA [Candidatus Gracilibacteria bacterium]|nr:16S rRNA (adenine(1518)-N(6)/adenine(1519)-N(6))-dimethyltransferase RsmA [Candidatus Gracilibacteria bacterium]